MVANSHKSLTEAIRYTVAYSDIFDYPLTAHEIHRYLTGVKASFELVNQVLQNGNLLAQTGVYFTIRGREEIVSIRMEREARSKELLPYALRYGRILGSLPFIRMVALTGSLAVRNVSGNADFDYMLITVPGRVWTARAFALLFNRMVKLFGRTICPNLIISENALAWSQHDLYTARELCQMIPIAGMGVYQKLIKANEWATEYLPNAFMESNSLLLNLQEQVPALQRILELPLRGKLGDSFEKWEMNRKIARFSKQKGFGTETVFNSEVCQGNFDHHARWTQKEFKQRLDNLSNDFPVPAGEGISVKTT
jgi:hypothetical protein